MASETNLFIGLVLFYFTFFTLLGVVPADDIGVTVIIGSINNSTSVLQVTEDYGSESITSTFGSFVDNIFSNISGLPPVVKALVFSPLLIFAGYWLIKFLLNFIPFLGGS